ncbi:hypothetical protein [Streptomyces sp. NPDC001970]
MTQQTRTLNTSGRRREVAHDRPVTEQWITGVRGTGVGLIVLRGRDALQDRVSRSPALRTWSLRLPLFAASAVVVGGAVASAQAAARLAGS